MRLTCMEDWVREWALPEMFAGVAQQGAIDAWYQVLTDIEDMPLSGIPYCGGAADIHKLFDQILLPMGARRHACWGAQGKQSVP